jgi:LmbE family N-acetylglucosaminyl deacetylase
VKKELCNHLKIHLALLQVWLNYSMRWIYLSPHLDDAVLSAGGLIYDQCQSGITVEIWTFMCGFPPEGEFSQFAQLQHYLWGAASGEEAVQARREEDCRAAAIVGARAVHLDFLDCIYRRGSNGEWLYSDISVPPHEQDAGLPDRIAEAIRSRVQPDDVLVCQLAIGSHVDHVLVRQGAERTGLRLLYDIDIPYFFSNPGELALKSAGMRESLHSISETGLKAWQEAVLEYKSQLPLFGEFMYTPEKAREALRSYRDQQGGIRLLQFN